MRGHRIIARGKGIAAAAAIICLCLTGGAARARTCTVDLDQLELLRKEILDLVKSDVHVDSGKAGELKHKYGDVLKGGPITVDPNDLKGVLQIKRKPSAAMIRDMLAHVQSIIASCQQ